MKAEVEAEFAAFLAGRGRADEARALLAEARAAVEGTGARLYERLIDEAEAVIDQPAPSSS
jgi:hypothetical protein